MSTCSSRAGCDGVDTLSNEKNTSTELGHVGGDTTGPFCFKPLVLPAPGVRTTTATQMPVQVVPSGRCKAAVRLKFIVVGGSIGGGCVFLIFLETAFHMWNCRSCDGLYASKGWS